MTTESRSEREESTLQTSEASLTTQVNHLAQDTPADTSQHHDPIIGRLK